jgi:Protein of unknown function (DUF2281)
MTIHQFTTQFPLLPVNIQQEILDFYDYLQFKYKNFEPSLVPNKKTLKAGFLKGTFIMSEDFNEPLEDFKENS